jgi:hypothetical protein
MPDTSPPLPPEKKRLGETSDDSFSTGSLAAFSATVMGFAFAFGVLARLFQREAGDRAGKLLDGTAVCHRHLPPPAHGLANGHHWPAATRQHRLQPSVLPHQRTYPPVREAFFPNWRVCSQDGLLGGLPTWNCAENEDALYFNTAGRNTLC